jgi:hypothetical protein
VASLGLGSAPTELDSGVQNEVRAEIGRFAYTSARVWVSVPAYVSKSLNDQQYEQCD